MAKSNAKTSLSDAFTSHGRHWKDNRYVYPVVSRRAGGISIGVNLNPDKACNFDCIYCQVNRRIAGAQANVDLPTFTAELDAMLTNATNGRLFTDPPFANLPPDMRRINDIAFSGDGEPTTFRNFAQVIERAAALKADHRLDHVKLVLITNASMFHKPAVRRGLQILDRNNGEIWAKLDAGTEPYYQKVCNTNIRFQRILDNIAAAARERPIVIQSLFMRIDGQGPSDHEIDAYCQRLRDVLAAGGSIKLVQVYTVARPPAQARVSALGNQQLDRIAAQVRAATGLPAAAFYGAC